jgi:hypothetical protein
MAEAWGAGRVLTGRELAEAVYGRSGDAYMRAVRQLVRELRLKLPLYYGRLAEPPPIQFSIADDRHELIVTTADPAPSAERGEASTTGSDGLTREPDPPTGRVQTLESPDSIRAMRRTSGRWRARRRTTVGVLALALLSAMIVAIVRRPVNLPWSREGSEGVAGAALPSPWPLGPRGTHEDREALQHFASFPLQSDEHDARQVQVVSMPESSGAPGRRLAVASCNPASPETCRLRILDRSSNRTLAEVVTPLPPPSAGKEPWHLSDASGAIPRKWRVSSLAAADLDGDGRRDEIVAAFMHGDLYPTQLLAFSEALGLPPLLEFWSMGHVYARVLPDTDGDGRDEIILFGVNNAQQSGILTLIPPLDDDRPTRGRTPPGWRPTLPAEIEDYPVRGLHISVPSSDLGSPSSPLYCAVRSSIVDIAWIAPSHRLVLSIQDTGRLPEMDWPLRFDLTLDLELPTAHVTFVDYDAYLKTLLRFVAEGRLQDRWGLRTQGVLDLFGEDMASRARMWDAESDQQQWGPLRPEPVVARLLRSTSSP